jgi:hypothetical protein
MSSRFKKKYICPLHKEDTPSAVVYGDRFFCFGCRGGGPVSDVGLTPEDLEAEESAPKYVENIAETYAKYINKLPMCPQRGLSFPTDSGGYFIAWPTESYYKYRKFSFDKEAGKYRSPVGVKKPPFIIPKNLHSDILVVVEGEINAMSIDSLSHSYAIVSPGSSGDFYSQNFNKYIDWILSYKHIIGILDNDKAGVKGCIEFKSKLLTMGHTSNNIVLWDKDANDILVTEGKEALNDRMSEELGVFKRM